MVQGRREEGKEGEERMSVKQMSLDERQKGE